LSSRRAHGVRRYLLLLIAAGTALYAATPALLRRAFRVGKGRSNELPSDVIWIQGRRGKRLAARYLVPPGVDPLGVALVMHGWGSSSERMLAAVEPLHGAGLSVLLIDARCHGASDDDDLTSMPRFAEDIESGLEWLGDHQGIDPRRVILIGHSVGAGAALLAATRIQVAGVVTLSSMAHPRDMMKSSMARARIPRAIVAYVMWRMQRILGQRFDEFAPVNTIRRVSSPVLIVHGDSDVAVPLSDAYRLQQSARQGTRVLVIQGADHRAPDAFVREAGEITSWITSLWSDADVYLT